MKRSLFVVVVCLIAGMLAAQTSGGQAAVSKPAEQKLMQFPNLPDCAKGAVVDGDPGTGPSTILAKWPAGCKVPMHWHTPNENLVIVSGGGKLDMKDGGAQNVAQGAFVHMPSKHQHAFTCTSACTFYLVSDGTFDIHYVDKEGKEISAEQAIGKTGARMATKD